MGQLMRLNEALTAQVLAAQGAIIEGQNRQIQLLMGQQERLLQDRIGVIETLETLRSEQSERDERRQQLSAQREERAKLVTKVIDQAMPHLGPAVGKLLPKVFGDRDGGDEMRSALQRILGKLSPDTLASIVGDLGPEERRALEELFAVVATKKERAT
jgi:hypothetical protein